MLIPPQILGALVTVAVLGLLPGLLPATPPVSKGDKTSSQGSATTVEVSPLGNQMVYQKNEITAKAGTMLTIVVKNTAESPALWHNFVLLKPNADINAIGVAAIQAGPDKGYIPTSNDILHYTKMAKPGETKKVTFTVPPPGDYPYVCLFPGHFVTMRGVLHSKRFISEAPPKQQ